MTKLLNLYSTYRKASSRIIVDAQYPMCRPILFVLGFFPAMFSTMSCWCGAPGILSLLSAVLLLFELWAIILEVPFLLAVVTGLVLHKVSKISQFRLRWISYDTLPISTSPPHFTHIFYNRVTGYFFLFGTLKLLLFVDNGPFIKVSRCSH